MSRTATPEPAQSETAEPQVAITIEEYQPTEREVMLEAALMERRLRRLGFSVDFLAALQAWGFNENPPRMLSTALPDDYLVTGLCADYDDNARPVTLYLIVASPRFAPIPEGVPYDQIPVLEPATYRVA